MNVAGTIFSQLLYFIPQRQFRRIVKKYNGEKGTRTFKCWDQYLCMVFAQLTYRESLRDIEVCLRAVGNKLYHSGIRGKISRSTLARANNSRDWRIYRDIAHLLIKRARPLYVDEPFGVDLQDTVYALDATIITLCLSIFPWARYKNNKGGVKLHTQIDLRGNIPVFIAITEARYPDVKALDQFVFEAGATYIMDKGYTDYSRLHKINQALASFVIRAKSDISYKRLSSSKVDILSGVLSDQIVRLRRTDSAKHYPDKLRRIRYFDKIQKRYFVFITNNFLLPAKIIADLYRCRWQVELFFK